MIMVLMYVSASGIISFLMVDKFVVISFLSCCILSKTTNFNKVAIFVTIALPLLLVAMMACLRTFCKIEMVLKTAIFTSMKPNFFRISLYGRCFLSRLLRRG